MAQHQHQKFDLSFLKDRPAIQAPPLPSSPSKQAQYMNSIGSLESIYSKQPLPQTQSQLHHQQILLQQQQQKASSRSASFNSSSSLLPEIRSPPQVPLRNSDMIRGNSPTPPLKLASAANANTNSNSTHPLNLNNDRINKNSFSPSPAPLVHPEPGEPVVPPLHQLLPTSPQANQTVFDRSPSPNVPSNLVDDGQLTSQLRSSGSLYRRPKQNPSDSPFSSPISSLRGFPSRSDSVNSDGNGSVPEFARSTTGSFFRPRPGSITQRRLIASVRASPFSKRSHTRNSLSTSTTASTESSNLDEEMKDSVAPLGIFKNSNNSPSGGSKVDESSDSPTLFPDNRRSSTSSIISDSSVLNNELPLDLKVIIDSRPSDMVHDMVGFDNQQYTEFWGLTSEESKIFIAWNKLEFQRQNRVFEYFLLLKRIRFNVRRMVYHYGAEFKKAKGLTAEQTTDYEKTFVPLKSFCDYLDKLVVSKLKNAYDNSFFVNDKYVLEISKRWFIKLEKDFDYISRSMVYLARLSANEHVRDWIEKVEATDEAALNNHFAAGARELFSSYFLKFLTPLGLLVFDLKKLYTKMGDEKMTQLSQELYDSLTRVNKTSDYTSDLDKKIGLNDKMVCKNYLYLEMVDLFNKDRKTRVPVEIYMKTQIGYDNAVIALFDNYFLPLMLTTKRGQDIYTLNKPPVPLQYASFDVREADDIQYLTVRDPGNEDTHDFKYDNVEAPVLFKHFITDCGKYKEELFKKLSKSFYFKMINCTSFYHKLPYYEYNITPCPEEDDIITQAIGNANYKPSTPNLPPSVETEVLCIDCFKYSNYLLFAIGTSSGLYLGVSDNPGSWKKVCSFSAISKIVVVENDMMFMQASSKLYSIKIDSLGRAYFRRVSICDSEFKTVEDHIQSFEVGYQGLRRGPRVETALYLFCWREKKIKYSVLSSENKWKLNFSQMRATFQVQGLQFLYPKDFVISHVNENNPIFYLSDLVSMTNTQLPQLDEDKDLKNRLRGEKPVSAFKFTIDSAKNYDIILVYSKYCVFVNYSEEYGYYKRSRNEILRFGFKCTDAAFDDKENSLVLIGAQNMEIWKIPTDRQAKSEIVSCAIARKVRFLNKTPGKIILGFVYNGSKDEKYKYGGAGNQIVLHLRKTK